MSERIFSFVPEARIRDVLGNLQAFTGLAIQLIGSDGTMIMSFGQSTIPMGPIDDLIHKHM